MFSHTEFLNAIGGSEIPAMAARAFVIYLALIVLLRVAKKRFMGDATVFDVVLSVIIGSIAGRTIAGGAPVAGALAAIAVLIALHWLFSWLGMRWPTFACLIKGSSDFIIRNGKVNRRAMRAAHMGDDDLAEDLRNEGVNDVRDVAEARLERSGKLSVIKRKKR